MNSLSEEEREMFLGVIEIARSARTYQWLLENQVHLEGVEGQAHYGIFYYEFGSSLERSQTVRTPIKARLEFISDQKIFLEDGPPARTAVTSSAPNDPIFVNQTLINQPATKMSFADAIQIMIHEFGHKLGAKENKSAVNDMAAKIKTFVDAQTSTFKLSNGHAQMTKFKNSEFEIWFESMTKGEYVGVNIPPRRPSFRAIADEGIYAFIENPAGTFDISAALMADLKQVSRFEPYSGQAISWKHLHSFYPYSYALRETEPGKLRLEINVYQAQAVFPFLEPGDPSPESYQPWARLQGPADLTENHRMEWTFDNPSGPPVKTSYWPKPVVFENAEVPILKLSEQWDDEDLLLSYRVPLKVEVKGSGNVPVRAFLTARLGADVLELPGQRQKEDPRIVVFRLSQAKTKLNGAFKPIHVEVEPEFRNLAAPAYVRTRLLLEPSPGLQLQGQPATNPLKFERLEIWNGSAWTRVSPMQNFTPKSKLRLVIQSATDLVSVKLRVEIRKTQTNQTTIYYGNETPQKLESYTYELAPTITTFVVSTDGIPQSRDGNFLYMPVSMNQNFENEITNEYSTTLPLPYPLPGGSPRTVESETLQVLPERKLLGVEITNQAAQQLRIDLFTRAQSLNCHKLFSKRITN